MDQTAHDVEEDLKNILRTRQALGDKIQLLEQQVEQTLRGTRCAAMDAIDVARNRVVDFFEMTAQYLDPSTQAKWNPWILVGGAVALGFLAGRTLRRRKSGVYPYYLPKARGVEIMPSGRPAKTAKGIYPFYPARRRIRNPRPASVRIEETRPAQVQSTTEASDIFGPLFSVWESLAGELTKERSRLQEAVRQIGRSFFHDFIHIVGQSLIAQLSRSSSRSAVPGLFQRDRIGSS